ncbi:hypothetical protein [Pseudoalteromonas tunicata]|uniref:hypothetical protein n=1 Tax=Pseudoalteromonas tunicata TaxID=314281 RepID=UPI00273EEDD4|nr:hypothetical protein [Pseudoalteromonas tunicata]MDP4985337.1 hypothetical protein [Pseudoalteromonas tunicata]
MNKINIVKSSVWLAALFFSNQLLADNKEIVLQEVKKLDFNTVFARVGNCHFDVEKQDLVHSDSSVCTYSIVEKGQLKLIAEPLTTVEIEFKSNLSVEGKVIFNPEALAISELGRYSILTNKPVAVKVGASGVVDIDLGGTLKVISQLGPDLKLSASYGVEYQYIK